MSTEFFAIEQGKGGHTDFTRFYGGREHGVCLQITQGTGYIQLSVPEIIAALGPIKEEVIDAALKSKKQEAEEAIQANKELLKTIVADIREVSDMAIKNPIFTTASLLCFKQPKTNRSIKEKGDE